MALSTLRLAKRLLNQRTTFSRTLRNWRRSYANNTTKTGKKRCTLGSSTLSVHPIGLGCMGMSEYYGTRPPETNNVRTIHRALELGVNFLDTAEIYGLGHNEELLGKAINQSTAKRDDVVIATKFGVLVDDGKFVLCGKPNNVRKSCEGSLKRLGLNHIDLYYQHRPDPETPIEETVDALAQLVKEGKIKAIGLSEVTPELLRRAHKVHPIAAVQCEYSLWSTEPEFNGVMDTCKELNVTFVAYAPLASGFITGTIKRFDQLAPNDKRRSSARFQPENFAKNLKLAHLVQEMAKEKNVTPSQLALAWVLRRPGVVAIPGTKQIQNLEENWGTNFVDLNEEEENKLQHFLTTFDVAGERYWKGYPAKDQNWQLYH